MAEDIVPGESRHNLTEKLIREFKRLFVMVFYLWVVFGLYVLSETIVMQRQHVDLATHGFAIINALVLAKVLLIAEDLGFANRFGDKPLAYPILFKALAFALLFIVFHVFESMLIGLWHGKRAIDSLPEIGGGSLKGLLCVLGIMFVSLIPFFAFLEIGRVIGEDELWALIFKRGNKQFKLQSVAE